MDYKLKKAKKCKYWNKDKMPNKPMKPMNKTVLDKWEMEGAKVAKAKMNLKVK